MARSGVELNRIFALEVPHAKANDSGIQKNLAAKMRGASGGLHPEDARFRNAASLSATEVARGA